MSRMITDNPKGNIQVALNLFYTKDGWTWVRGGGPAPDFPDVSLCDYVRNLVKRYIPDENLPVDDYELSSMMSEWLMDGVDTIEGVIATLYTVGWAFSALRHQLKAYEDTELEPKDIERIVDAYGRGITLREEVSQRIELIRDIETDRLREIAEAERDGRLPVPPCKVGDTVYIPSVEKRDIVPVRVQGISISVSGRTILRFGGYPVECAWGDACGKAWFLTREAAEYALEGGGTDA